MLAELPLDIANYDPAVAHETLAAITAVLDKDPVHVEPTPPSYQPAAIKRTLPETAPKLVGVVGKRGSGKDHGVDFIESEYQGVRRMAFSDSIMDEVNSYLSPTGHVITSTNKNEVDEYRRILQMWGIHARPFEDPDYWVKAVARKIKSFQNQGARLVMVTGSRLPQDLDFLRSLEAKIWRVRRPDWDAEIPDGSDSKLDSLPDTDFDRVILNPVENDVLPYEANLLAALHDGPSSQLDPVTVAIDGPAGAGKSTVAKAVAERLHYTYLDTGAMYRCVALAAERSQRPAAEIAGAITIGLADKVTLDGEDVSELIRTPEISQAASVASSDPAVRDAMTELQRRMLASGNYVAEGRDIGTIVRPDAQVKVYLTATDEERARRRAAQTGEDPQAVLDAQRERDQRDSTRAIAPLRAAEDAVVVDSTGLDVGDITDQIVTSTWSR
jgi:cytidylate kinase